MSFKVENEDIKRLLKIYDEQIKEYKLNEAGDTRKYVIVRLLEEILLRLNFICDYIEKKTKGSDKRLNKSK